MIPTSHETQAEVDLLLDKAEAHGLCLVPPNRAIEVRLQRRMASGSVCMPYRGIYARASHWESLNPRARALFAMRSLCALHPDWVFCGPSAALAHGLYLSWSYCQQLHVMLPSSSHDKIMRSDDIVWERTTCKTRVSVLGVRVTPLDQTAIDCLCRFSFSDGLGIADSWARITDNSKQELLQIINEHGARRHGVAHARLAVLSSDFRSENGGESQARAIMLECGYEKPYLQVEIPDPVDLGNPYRVDYLWNLPEGIRVVGELDGTVKYRDPSAMNGLDAEGVRERERLRESRLAIPGTAVMRFSLSDAKNRQRFRRILDSYGIPRTPESLKLARAIQRAYHLNA